MTDEPDYYAVLGVSRKATPDEIKRAYRRLTLAYHPDRNPEDDEVHQRYRLINRAYEVLSEPMARLRYDTSSTGLAALRSVQTNPRKVIRQVVSDVFGIERRNKRRGRDLRYTLTVDLAAALLGSTHNISFEALNACDVCQATGTKPGGRAPHACSNCAGLGEIRTGGLLGRRTACGACDGTGLVQSDPCERCRGRGMRRELRHFAVTLPPGTLPGAQRVIVGQGEPGRFGGASGDLRVTVNVRPHPQLRMDGANITSEVFVSVTEAALGASVPIETLDGVVELRVPASLQSETKLRLRGKGVPQGTRRGDHLVTVKVETPVVVHEAVRVALLALEQACLAPRTPTLTDVHASALEPRDFALPKRNAQRPNSGP